MFSHLSLYSAHCCKLLIQNSNRGAVSRLQTGPVHLFMSNNRLAGKGVRREGHRRETALSSPLKTVLRSAVMQAGPGSQTWPGAVGVAWWENSGGRRRPAWVNDGLESFSIVCGKQTQRGKAIIVTKVYNRCWSSLEIYVSGGYLRDQKGYVLMSDLDSRFQKMS